MAFDKWYGVDGQSNAGVHRYLVRYPPRFAKVFQHGPSGATFGADPFDWDESDPFGYRAALAASLARAPVGAQCALAWIHGEGDSYRTASPYAGYTADAVGLFDELSVVRPDLLFVVVLLSTDITGQPEWTAPNIAAFRAAQSDIADAPSLAGRVRFVDSSGLATSDGVHRTEAATNTLSGLILAECADYFDNEEWLP